MRDLVLFNVFVQIEIWNDLTESGVLLEELRDFGFVSTLIDLIRAIKFLYEVHHSQDAVKLFVIFHFRFVVARQLHSLVHH